jgi:hypothetical protein
VADAKKRESTEKYIELGTIKQYVSSIVDIWDYQRMMCNNKDEHPRNRVSKIIYCRPSKVRKLLKNIGAAITKSKNERFVDRGIQDTSISRTEYQSLCIPIPLLNPQAITTGRWEDRMEREGKARSWNHVEVFVCWFLLKTLCREAKYQGR